MVTLPGHTHVSHFERLHALPLTAVDIQAGFWKGKQAVNRHNSLPHGFAMLEESGALDNLRIAAGMKSGEHRGMRFQDSDVYKWLEAASYELAKADDPALRQQVDAAIDLIAAAQMEDGYINSYYQIKFKPENRWTNEAHDHELYCAGHLIEAAVAHHRATGSRRLLDIACRFADHIDTVFGKGKREEAPGHQGVELALIELYRETGEIRYLALAEFFINERGKNTMKGWAYFSPSYYQDRVPVRDNDRVEGHAVRAIYLTSGMADLYLETGEQALLDALHRQWHDFTSHKMYITGGAGARHFDEAFGEPYELPDDTGYCETCAAIASIMWNWRMLRITGQARYAALIERTLYNGFLSGVSLDGRTFFYVNPLFVREAHVRQPWFQCACCPPNVMRLIASLNRYLVTVSAGELQVHQYAGAAIAADIPEAGPLHLTMETAYPWDGAVRITVDDAGSGDWRLRLRIPDWCSAPQVQLNGQPVEAALEEGYLLLAQRWQSGDVIALDLPMVPRLMRAHPYVSSSRGALALERGPLVYCLEGVDQPEATNVLQAQLDPNTAFQVEPRPDLLDGTVLISGYGFLPDLSAWENRLYLPHHVASVLPRRPVELHFVPYHQWGNRGTGPMRVWVPMG
ncbi:MAG: glycoside hydrolase family 127 protein [Anaerolineae bacterium]|nr:glycoside hydrolase family 127 protein [Anaerolineae bacterium]